MGFFGFCFRFTEYDCSRSWLKSFFGQPSTVRERNLKVKTESIYVDVVTQIIRILRFLF